MSGGHLEKIKCPKCGAIETAQILHTRPFWSYVHDCSKCGYTIMESEWDEVKEEASDADTPGK